MNLQPGKFFIVDVRIDIHLPGVDLHDARSGFLGGRGEFNFTVEPATQWVVVNVLQNLLITSKIEKESSRIITCQNEAGQGRGCQLCLSQL